MGFYVETPVATWRKTCVLLALSLARIEVESSSILDNPMDDVTTYTNAICDKGALGLKSGNI